MRRMAAWCLILLLLISTPAAISANPQSNWPNLTNFIGQEIAIKTKDGVTKFGVLRSVDVFEIKVQLADEQQFSVRETSFKRDEVAKIWRATLRFGERNTGKGALIGAGVGLGAGFVTALVLAKQENSGPPHGLGLFPIIGAGVGAIIGGSKLKDHKKQKLIYSI